MTTLYNFQMLGLFETKAPVIHTEETIGNLARIKRMKILNAGEPVSVPALSGNSFRGQLRDLIGDHFIEMIQEDDNSVEMSPLVYGVIFSGGVLKDKYKTLGEHMESLMKAVPLLRLMGSAFGNRMMPSKISVSHLVPLAKGTEGYLEDTLSEFPVEGHDSVNRLAKYRDNLPLVEELAFEEGPLTRKNDEENPVLTRNVALEGEKVEKQQMIYHVECITGGTMMLQRVNSKFPVDEIELGCLLDGLRVFAKAPFIGGRSAAGYGRVDFTYYMTLTPLNDEDQEQKEFWLDKDVSRNDFPNDLKTKLKAYQEDIETRSGEIREALAEV
jgi:hypothetical protein